LIRLPRLLLPVLFLLAHAAVIVGSFNLDPRGASEPYPWKLRLLRLLTPLIRK
jgi:hypothetical protein